MKTNEISYKTWLRSFVFLVMAAGLLAGCRRANPLVGTSWTLVELDGQDVVPGTTITATFKDEAIMGSGGCNRYSLNIYIEENAIVVEKEIDDQGTAIIPIFTTDGLCLGVEGLMEQETRFLQTLEKITAYIILDDHLSLKNEAGDVILVFQQTP